MIGRPGRPICEPNLQLPLNAGITFVKLLVVHSHRLVTWPNLTDIGRSGLQISRVQNFEQARKIFESDSVILILLLYFCLNSSFIEWGCNI